ncbi:helix-turn-helix transcriptional regulator [Pseudomarimonas salicorniae]|uniref:Helix-turn-helix transcriptional regulator n=1 Tax=Pseudomarimonas salicorniae TaxID=2933270 RepID=A0ABT0GIX9_9GAMM|nr:helix-turn-helix transcriptional regulator [Lysobacter sp. CAU 1642]MCK7594500.1 helix-turn-helix transcriptional regulator [Lysobacter sp. CAU 1642]
MDNPVSPAGRLLRDWRQRRQRSQQQLALDAGVSARHLSFVETGRARPSRELILQLCLALGIPLRERNRLLLAGGFAPAYAERALDSAALDAAREALQRLLAAHEPYPALVVDRHWNLQLANRPARALLGMVDPSLLQGRINVLRVSLHPRGLAPAIINLAEMRAYFMRRVGQLASDSGDPVLAELRDELAGYAPLPGEGAAGQSTGNDFAVLLRLRSPVGELALLSTLTVFGAPADVTLSELALEALFPADAETAERLTRLASA